jgi:hypothetical protein
MLRSSVRPPALISLLGSIASSAQALEIAKQIIPTPLFQDLLQHQVGALAAICEHATADIALSGLCGTTPA